MKKNFLVLLAFTTLGCLKATAQRGIKIAYIDMEYILDKVPDYAEAKNQLEQRAGKWKQEIDVKRNDINKLKEGLKAERALLTNELIEEREEEIAFLEKELIDYQEKRFGPTGDLISQKSVLVKPIQDQVFTIIQDLAEVRKYDFVFDKSSDLTMIFSAQKHDISDLVIRRLTRASKRERLSSKELKQLEEQEAQEDLESDPEYQAKQEKIEERKSEREKLIEDRNAAREKRRQEQLEKREQQLREREARRNGTAPSQAAPATTDNVTDDDDAPVSNRPAATVNNNGQKVDEPIQGENTQEVKTTATDKPSDADEETIDRQNAAQTSQEQRQAKLDARKKAIREREERKQKILADREAAKKAREEELKEKQEENEESAE